MTDAPDALDAKARLAITRAHLLAAMGYEEIRGVHNETINVVSLPPAPGRRPGAGTLKVRWNRSIAGRWWRRSPVRSAVELGRPLLETYASHHPGSWLLTAPVLAPCFAS